MISWDIRGTSWDKWSFFLQVSWEIILIYPRVSWEWNLLVGFKTSERSGMIFTWIFFGLFGRHFWILWLDLGRLKWILAGLKWDFNQQVFFPNFFTDTNHPAENARVSLVLTAGRFVEFPTDQLISDTFNFRNHVDTCDPLFSAHHFRHFFFLNFWFQLTPPSRSSFSPGHTTWSSQGLGATTAGQQPGAKREVWIGSA